MILYFVRKYFKGKKYVKGFISLLQNDVLTIGSIRRNGMKHLNIISRMQPIFLSSLSRSRREVPGCFAIVSIFHFFHYGLGRGIASLYYRYNIVYINNQNQLLLWCITSFNYNVFLFIKFANCSFSGKIN